MILRMNTVISLNCFNQFLVIFIFCVHFEVRTKYLNITNTSFGFGRLRGFYLYSDIILFRLLFETVQNIYC
jgi:hypothetical protein